MKKSLKIYLIRHTQSQFNHIMKKKVGLNHQVPPQLQNLDVKFSFDLIDCGISQAGYQSCQKTAQLTKKINFKLILTSPLKRSIISAQQFFQKHPSKPKVILQPLMTQMMLSSCDVGGNILESKTRYNFDFNFLANIQYKKLWVLQNLPRKPEIMNQLKKITKNQNELQKDGPKFLVKLMGGLYPQFYETLKDVEERSIRLKKQIFDKYAKMLGQGEQMALIMHFRMAECLTAKSFDQNNRPIGGLHLKNAEITEVILQQ